VDGPKPQWPFSLAVRTPEDGRQTVRSLTTAGADFIKVYHRLPRDAYFAIADEARKQGIAFAGHVPPSVSAAEASDAGQESMEHMLGLLLASSTREEEIRREELKCAD
jgi:hypothetical protein